MILEQSLNLFLSGKKAKLAKKHLDEVCALLEKVDVSLKDIAYKSIPEIRSETEKKRKATEDRSKVAKKKKSETNLSIDKMTLSQREERGMEQLTAYLVECGGMSTVFLLFKTHLKLLMYLLHYL